MRNESIFDDWNPHSVIHNVDSVPLGIATIVLAFVTMVLFLLIATRWLTSSRYASRDGRNLWRWLVAIFLLTGLTTYGSLDLTVLWPRVAVWNRLIGMAVIDIACVIFLRKSSIHKFTNVAIAEHIGERIAVAASEPCEMSDRELASLARQLVAKSLQRQCESEKETD